MGGKGGEGEGGRRRKHGLESATEKNQIEQTKRSIIDQGTTRCDLKRKRDKKRVGLGKRSNNKRLSRLAARKGENATDAAASIGRNRATRDGDVCATERQQQQRRLLDAVWARDSVVQTT